MGKLLNLAPGCKDQTLLKLPTMQVFLIPQNQSNHFDNNFLTISCFNSGISIEKLENQLIQLKATFSEKEKMLENLKTR